MQLKMSDQQWSQEELKLLNKGLQKYPGGTAKRWFYIAQFISTKDEKEVLRKSKEIAGNTDLKCFGSILHQNPLNQYLSPNIKPVKKIDVAPDIRDIGDRPDSAKASTAATTRTQSLDSNSDAAAAVEEERNTISVPGWTPEQQKVRWG